MSHSRNKEESAPILHLLHPAVFLAHPFVIADRIECRKPRIAHAVIVDEFSAVTRKRCKVRPERIAGSSCCICIEVNGGLFRIVLRARRRLIHRTASTAAQNTGNAGGIDAAGVMWKRGIDGVYA